MSEWAANEFAAAKLGDKRLDKRPIKLGDRFADKPTASIPGACADRNETKGAHRLLGQKKIGWKNIPGPHMAGTGARMRQHPVVPCIRDTTEPGFNGRQISGSGPLSHEAQRGMYLHPTCAVAPQREPPGVTDAWMWGREFKDAGGNRPGPLESGRWIEGYERVAQVAARAGNT